MAMIKAFFAISLPEASKLALHRLSQEWQKKIISPGIKWEKWENFHITLRFLGMTSTATISKILPLIASQLKDISSFDLTLTQVQLFHSIESSKILALSMEPKLPLIQLNELLESIITSVGLLPAPRSFIPHLTLARLKSPTKLPTEFLELPVTFHINNIVLFHSETLPTHTIYHQITRIPLQDHSK